MTAAAMSLPQPGQTTRSASGMFFSTMCTVHNAPDFFILVFSIFFTYYATFHHVYYSQSKYNTLCTKQILVIQIAPQTVQIIMNDDYIVTQLITEYSPQEMTPAGINVFIGGRCLWDKATCTPRLNTNCCQVQSTKLGAIILFLFLTYYLQIILDSFWYLLFSKLCQHILQDRFNCENLIIANCEFFQSLQSFDLQRISLRNHKIVYDISLILHVATSFSYCEHMNACRYRDWWSVCLLVAISSKSPIFLRLAKPNYQQTFLEKGTRQ